MLLVERSSELVLCFLDKHDIEKLARGKGQDYYWYPCSFRGVVEQRRIVQTIFDNIQIH